jgi:hypothetical protein
MRSRKETSKLSERTVDDSLRNTLGFWRSTYKKGTTCKKGDEGHVIETHDLEIRPSKLGLITRTFNWKAI